MHRVAIIFFELGVSCKNFNRQTLHDFCCLKIIATIDCNNYHFHTAVTFTNLNPIQDGLFWGCTRMGGGKKAPLPKICHAYPENI